MVAKMKIKMKARMVIEKEKAIAPSLERIGKVEARGVKAHIAYAFEKSLQFDPINCQKIEI